MTADLYSWQTRADRKRLAEQLYGDGWTMQRIAAALSVSQATITRDLAEFIPQVQTTRPTGGRPKGTVNKPARSAPITTIAETNKPAPVAVAESDQQTKPGELQEEPAATATAAASRTYDYQRDLDTCVTCCSFCEREFTAEEVLGEDTGVCIYTSETSRELGIGICCECVSDAYLVFMGDRLRAADRKRAATARK